MRKIILYIAQSLDGFIATKSGSVDWLNDDVPSSAGDYGYTDFLQTIDTTLMGYNTYKQIISFDIPFPYPDKKNFVFSKTHRHTDKNPVEFINSDIITFASKLKESAEKDIWLIGGGEINKQFLNANLIDEIIISIKPVILGDGIPMFEKGTDFKKFQVERVETFDHSIIQFIMKRK